jgi:hypothetical protein
MKYFIAIIFTAVCFIISCKDDKKEVNPNTNIHFIIANESVIDDSIDIKIQFGDRLLIDEIFTFDGSSTDYQFREVTVPKGEYLINVWSDISQKQREEIYDFHEDDYWFLIFYWNPRGTASPDNEFQFTIHNDIIMVG